jgi:hypothetical protein
MFSTADFVDSFVGHADPWKQQWFLSRFSTSNCTFDDMPQGVSGAIKKRGGFRPFRELGRVGSRRNRMEIPRRKIPSDLEFPQARWCFARQSTRHTLQAIQVVVGYSGWRLLDGPTPQRGGGIAGSCNETRWLYAPRGRKGIAQGKAKRRPGIRYATIFASPERAKPAASSMRTCSALSGLWRIGAAAHPGRSRTTQGGASLYPGLSHYAPLGRTIRLRIGVDRK